MAMRVTGMNSGLDTESIITELVAVRKTKVDDLKGEQTVLGWKQEAWKDINTKIYNLFSGTLNNLKYQSSFAKKTTTVSNPNAVSVITDGTAMDSVQSLKIENLAKAGYLTGAKLTEDGDPALTSGSKLVESLGITAGSKFEVSTNGKTNEITIDENTTMSSLVSQLKSAGVNANFDAGQQRLYIGASATGEKFDFSLTSANGTGTDAMTKLGILVYDDSARAAYLKYRDMTQEDKDKVIADSVAALLKKYTAQKTALDTANTELAKAQAALIEDFKVAYPDRAEFDFTDNTARSDRKTEINNQITEIETAIADEDSTLTEEERTELQSDLNKLKGELSYINGYETNLAKIEENSDKILALETDGYLTAEGGAGTKLNEIATADLDAKIEAAEAGIAAIEGGATGNGFKQAGENSQIELNGVVYEGTENSIKVNGLTITCNEETAEGEEITLTTKDDTSGIYDMIKNFIKEYGTLINEVDKLYNAASSKGYDPLTDDEKDSMTEKEIEKWEEKIKDSLLRRDSTLNTVGSTMKEIMSSGFEVNGKKMYLYDFGIETLGYFNAAENEKNAYHVHGDADDPTVKNETNDLLAKINSDPDSVIGFFTQLSQKLSENLNKYMGTSEYSSVNKVYDDKKMKLDYDDYTTRIKEAEDKLLEYENKWYKKFGAMETALAKMQSNASAVTGLLGGN